MIQQQGAPGIEEVPLLMRGMESILRRLIRFLIGHVSLTRLQDLMNYIFVEEAENRLRQEKPQSTVTLSQLALLTGLDTRSISAIRKSHGYRDAQARQNELMRNYTPTTRLLDVWSTDPRYVETRTGNPKALTIKGGKNSLQALMSQAGFARGITPAAVAERLLLSGAVKQDPDTKKLEILTDRYLPSPGKDEEGAIEVGFTAIRRLIDTVLHNLRYRHSAEKRLYQRTYWTNRLAPHQRKAFQAKLTKLLEEAEEQGTETLREFEMTFSTPSQLTGGFGLFYFEQEPLRTP